MSEKSSPLIEQAKQQIEAVKGQSLSINERKDKAIALAAIMLDEAHRIQTPKEKEKQKQLAGMLNDPIGKIFTTSMTDQCFRSSRSSRSANQLVYVLKKYGIPKYLPFSKKLALDAFKTIGKPLAPILVPLTVHMLRNETSEVILPGEKKALVSHIQKRRKEGVQVNLNHLGEAILGEEEAKNRLQIYLDDLANPEIDCVSIKISTLYSQISLLAWDKTLDCLADKLRHLYRAAIKHPYILADGSKQDKWVNLDMEEYRDLACTVALFQKVLEEPEFHNFTGAGIALQSYLPDSFLIQQELTVWAMKRVANGGAPIKIRIVKGANLAMEQFEASLMGWPQAPYTQKSDVDANYKRMVNYACLKEHAKAVKIGVASHNLFDIAYALLLRSENGVENEIIFEMLEGMADNIRRVVQQLSGQVLLYCPAATKEEFQNAVAYLVRRLDENTAPENFLRHAFDLKPGTDEWKNQSELFAKACKESETIYYGPRRKQNRFTETFEITNPGCPFENEPDTDWSLPQHRLWAEHILNEWKTRVIPPIPLVISGKQIHSKDHIGHGEDPSFPGKTLYTYTLASSEQIDQALQTAKKSELSWGKTSVEERSKLLSKIANGLRMHRGGLIGAMVADTGKTVQEGDVEVSEAIDFAEYYRFSLEQFSQLRDIQWSPKGTVLVTPPWNFPCSIPAGGILAALAAGNCVLFKPAPEAILIGWELVQIFWEAGVPREVLQFIICEDEPTGSRLIKDKRVDAIILTGATSTAKLFLRLRPGLDLMAETGGKNSMIITALADRDLAIKSLLHSAFSHAGQKCSACSLAILEAEVYDDPNFRHNLRDAAASLQVGSPWDLKTKVNPLIHAPNPTLMKGLTTLEPGEEWLLEPKQDPKNPNIWSVGIKMGVTPSSFTFQNELFGPVLSLVRAKNFDEALKIANSTPYGLTAGLQSLDEREQFRWIDSIVAGNCYINRTITGAIVRRQPFGGCKESSFGRGAKAGGPNYLTQLMHPKQAYLPENREEPTNSIIHELSKFIVHDKELWEASIGSYSYFHNHYFSHMRDPSRIVGQDNLLRYRPYDEVTFRIQPEDTPLDILRVLAAAWTCRTTLDISGGEAQFPGMFPHGKETDEEFITRVSQGKIERVRLISQPTEKVQEALALAGCRLNLAPVLANGRLELLHYLRETIISIDYHRYGNLGEREGEPRAALPEMIQKDKSCGTSCCCR